jgi:hypothetical protein
LDLSIHAGSSLKPLSSKGIPPHAVRYGNSALPFAARQYSK